MSRLTNVIIGLTGAGLTMFGGQVVGGTATNVAGAAQPAAVAAAAAETDPALTTAIDTLLE
ncbi:MAG: hypothetical protein ACRDQD_15680, partial [Nocardioidaceae bacterium]